MDLLDNYFKVVMICMCNINWKLYLKKWEREECIIEDIFNIEY